MLLLQGRSSVKPAFYMGCHNLSAPVFLRSINIKALHVQGYVHAQA